MMKVTTPLYQTTPLLDLFPPITPYSSGYLDLDGGHHQMYWEQSGNPEGDPIVCLHGGPGSGNPPLNRQYFDPAHYRIVLYDQRGAGKSSPHGSLESNTRAHLVQDIEALRVRLGIEKWHVFGGSWGSTLALSYAAEHAHACSSLILRGIFLMEHEELDWLYSKVRFVFPEAWEQFSVYIPEDERGDLIDAYYRRLTGPDFKIRQEAALRWALYESACSSLIPNYQTVTTEEQKAHALALARIECHYFRHQVIGPEDSLLGKIDKFRHIPATIIHGRYDMVCPLVTAHKLHSLWPEADYVVVPDGGHSARDPAIRSRLIEAVENAKTLTSKI